VSRSQVTVALAGNPNAGKTSVFNALTGARQHVGNYPGVTVEYKEGSARVNGSTAKVVDLPGTYSLTAYSPEELVARNYIVNDRPDVVVDVVDAANLERNLYLAVQLMELGVPLVICLNMVDTAEQRGIKVDHEKLSQILGVPVVPTVARSGRGMEELIRVAVDLAQTKPGWRPLNISYGSDVDEGLSVLCDTLGNSARNGFLSARWLALKCLEGDTEVLHRLEEEPGLVAAVLPVCQRVSEHTRSTLDDLPEGLIADHRYGYIAGVTHQVLHHERELRMEFSDRVDRVLTNRLFGPMFLLGVLYAIYQFVFWASEKPVAWFEGAFALLGGAVEGVVPDGLLQSLIVSGVIDGVGGVLGFVPLILFMFFAIAIMEDSGYMARVAYLMDRLLRAFGLHGNSVMSLIVGGGISGGCAVPAVMATRTLKDPKARLATILVVPFMNCGAKLPVYAVLIGAFFAAQRAQMMFALTLISWSLALMAAKVLRATILRGEQAPFVMELPPYRTPTLKGLAIHTWERCWQYVKKAGTVILAISVLMWAAMTFPGLPAGERDRRQAAIAAAPSQEVREELAQRMSQAELAHSFAGRLGRALSSVTAPLGFDWRTNVALVGGFAAKEVIVSTLGTAFSLGEVDPEAVGGLSDRLVKEPGWNPLKAFALMLFVMVYAPCFVTVAVTRKETGSWLWALFSVAYTTSVAYVLALVVYRGGLALGLS
jgi:ferrous iron transport protein B